MANPLAAAIANASIDVLMAQDWRANIHRIEACLQKGLDGVKGDVRVLGAIGVVQLDHDVDVSAATRAAVDQGVWLRPFRDLIYTMPPYISTDADLARICTAVAAAATAG
jgi:adenosylmethionine-8-amino-7-oxononanoate aminotransferase